MKIRPTTSIEMIVFLPSSAASATSSVSDASMGATLPQPTVVRGEGALDRVRAGGGAGQRREPGCVRRVAKRGAGIRETIVRAEQRRRRRPRLAVAGAALGAHLRAERDQ